ncbi:MAG: hypothetical protein IPK16_24880 [Anaerolineales bacterium]|nr:hypothetical protein [Anaerolineales bacterium]
MAAAVRWVEAFDLPVADEPLLWQSNPHIIKALILIARHGVSDLSAAQHILDDLYVIAERTYHTRFKIQIRAMQALVLDLQGAPAAAEAALRDSVDLGRPGGLFVYSSIWGRLCSPCWRGWRSKVWPFSRCSLRSPASLAAAPRERPQPQPHRLQLGMRRCLRFPAWSNC